MFRWDPYSTTQSKHLIQSAPKIQPPSAPGARTVRTLHRDWYGARKYGRRANRRECRDKPIRAPIVWIVDTLRMAGFSVENALNITTIGYQSYSKALEAMHKCAGPDTDMYVRGCLVLSAAVRYPPYEYECSHGHGCNCPGPVG